MISQSTLSLVLSLVAVATAQNCTSLTIPVNVDTQAAHITLPEPVNQADLTAFFTNLATPSIDYPSTIINGTHLVKSQYQIAGKLCTPNQVTSNGTLEFATHGVAFDHSYWEVGGDNSKYNYAESAVASGHSIFYYDRLGSGNSSKPDGIQEVQSTVEVEIAHGLVQYLRAGQAGQTFGKVVGVGHSFGSVISFGVTSKYPEDFDNVVLTGFATGDNAGNSIGAGALGGVIASEAIPSMQLPSSYFVPGTISGYQFDFLKYPFYDPALASAQFEIRGSATIGEFATMSAPVVTATNFTGRVLVVTAIADIFFCAGNCAEKVNGTTPPNLVAQLYPAASNFSSYVPLDTAHGLNLHFSAPTTYSFIEKWIGA